MEKIKLERLLQFQELEFKELGIECCVKDSKVCAFFDKLSSLHYIYFETEFLDPDSYDIEKGWKAERKIRFVLPFDLSTSPIGFDEIKYKMQNIGYLDDLPSWYSEDLDDLEFNILEDKIEIVVNDVVAGSCEALDSFIPSYEPYQLKRLIDYVSRCVLKMIS